MYFIVYTKKRQTLYYKEPVSFFISFGKAKNWLPALALAAGKT